MKSLKRSFITGALLLSIAALPSIAQICISDPNGLCEEPEQTPTIYAAGVVYKPNWQAAMWVNNVITPLPPYVSTYNTGAKKATSIFAVDYFGTGEVEVYVGGEANITTNNYAAVDTSAMIWKNGAVFSQTPSISSTFVNRGAGVNSIFVEDGNVYSGGYTDKKSTSVTLGTNWAEMKPVMWMNGTQQLLTTTYYPFNVERSEVKAIYVRNGVTYAVGNSNYTVGHTPSVPRGPQELWLNGVHQTFLNLSSANSVFVTSTTLYVAGGLPLGYPVYNVGVQSGAAYAYVSTSDLTAGAIRYVPLDSNGNNAEATGIFVAKKTLFSRPSTYVVGWERRSTGYVAKLWVNGRPTDLSSDTEGAIATSVYVHNNDVYVGGTIYGSLTYNRKAVIWKNGQRIDMNGSEIGSEINSIFVK